MSSQHQTVVKTEKDKFGWYSLGNWHIHIILSLILIESFYIEAQTFSIPNKTTSKSTITNSSFSLHCNNPPQRTHSLLWVHIFPKRNFFFSNNNHFDISTEIYIQICEHSSYRNTPSYPAYNSARNHLEDSPPFHANNKFAWNLFACKWNLEGVSIKKVDGRYE